MMHQSAHATTRYINEKYGLSFNHTRLLKIFKKTLLKGEYRQNKAYCEPLLTPSEWDELQEIITRNIKVSPRRRVYLFSGLIRCPYCNRSLGGCFDGSRKHYRCAEHYYGSCPMKSHVNEKKMEIWLLENVEEDFKVNVTMKPKEKRENPQKYKDRLKRLNDMYLLGNISESEYKTKSAELQRKIAELSKEPKEKEVKFTSNWKDLYLKLDDSHRRSFWRGLIKEIIIDEKAQPVKILY
ncbi:MAG: zinc ribbon domain-containing protein [Mogibacterium sp.]|nr:zinc ribbon domain-containing protein [Mogibacterium sp.]